MSRSRRCHMNRVAILLAGLLSAPASPAGPAAAQSVQGQVSERQFHGPVQGALVLLLDSAGVTRGGYLTSPSGRFLIRAPGPGRYSLRVERIGYETVSTEPFQFAGEEALNRHLRMEEAPIQLDGIRVEGAQRCEIRREEGLSLTRVWDEARKALTVQDWITQEGAHRFQLSHWEREMDPQGRMVLSESRRAEQHLARTPTRTQPVEELLEKGFVQPDEQGGYLYHGPDAAVLLSELFLSRNCFRLTENSENADLIGLSFQPLQGLRPPAIEGTLWLDRQSSRLQFLEYDYTWSPWAEARGVAEGRIDFEELPGGVWIVRRWWIRMPRMEASPGLRPGSGLRLAGIREEGAEVTNITSFGLRPLPELPTGSITGVVYNSSGQAPLAGATVLLTSTGQRALTDPGGHFLLNSVATGRHQLVFTHPVLDSLGVVLPEAEVSVSAGRATSLDLFVPSREGLLEAYCGEVEAGTSALVGRVGTGSWGDPVPGATITLQWTRYRGPTSDLKQLQSDVHGLQTSSDATGRFRICAIPSAWPVTIQASNATARSASRELRVPPGEVMAVELTLDLPGVPSTVRGEDSATRCATPPLGSALGAVEGSLSESTTGVSMGGAIVRLMPADSGEAREGRTDGSGGFAFCDVPAGEWALEGWLGDYRGGPERLTVNRGERTVLQLALSFVSAELEGGLRGRVIDDVSGEPVALADVEIAASGRKTLTREDGAFLVSSLEPGEVTLKVSRLGYAEATGVVHVAAGEMVEVEVRLASQAIALDPITVTATRRYLPLSNLQEVQRRMDSGWGQFIAQDEIRARPAARVSELLVGSGVEVHANGDLIRMRRTKCEPLVYLDGQKLAGSAAEALKLVHPADLFAIEVYQGPGETPSRYIDSNSRCGVILLWTKRNR